MPGLCVGKANEHNQALTRELVRLHEKYPAMGLDSLYHMLKPAYSCSRGRMHRLMKAAGIHSLRKNAYKATTNSRHSHPIAPNLLQRQFSFAQPNLAWVGDITYIPTDEGWLYLAVVAVPGRYKRSSFSYAILSPHFCVYFICGDNAACCDIIHTFLEFHINLFFRHTADCDRLCSWKSHIKRYAAMENDLL